MDEHLLDPIQRQLKALGCRIPKEKAMAVYDRLMKGETPYAICRGKHNEHVSYDAVKNVKALMQEGKLDFLATSDHDPREIHRHDPFRITRYEIITEAEDLAPEWLFDYQSLMALGCITHADALRWIFEYKQLQQDRTNATIYSNYHDPDETVTYIAHFKREQEYLYTLYWIYYLYQFPLAEALPYIEEATKLIVRGKFYPDQHYVDAGHDLMRFAVWRGTENQEAYEKSQKRHASILRSHRKLMKELEDLKNEQ